MAHLRLLLPTHLSPLRRRRRRQAALGTIAIGLLAVALLAPARADASFTAGSGAASSQVLVLNIPYGGANIGFGAGVTKARFFEENATASAQTFDPGLLGLVSVLQLCGGALPLTLPPATTADTNRSGGQPDEHTKNVTNGSGVAGIETASAHPNAAGRALATGVQGGLPGIAELRNAVTRSSAVLDPATQTRTAVNEVDVGSLSIANGLVQLRGMRWYLDQTVQGPDNRSHTVNHTGTFTMASASLAGVPLPTGNPEQLNGTIATINGALRPLGVQIRMPQLVATEKGFEYTAMTLAIGGDTAYGKVLYPLLAGTNDLSFINVFNSLTQGSLFDAANCNSLGGLLKASPQFNALWNTLGVLTPILITALAAAINGGAEIDLSLGGARTSVDDTYYPPRPAYQPPPRPSVTTMPPTSTAPSAPARAVPPSSASTTTVPPAAATLTSKTSQQCATTSPVGRPMCWPGWAAMAAGLAGSLTLALMIGDEIWRRRRLAEVLGGTN